MDTVEKEMLSLRFHQKLMVNKMMHSIKAGEKDFLMAWKCRAGKTYGIGGLLNAYYKKYQKLNAMVITPAPTETVSQFTKDLFHKFRDFDEINIIEIKNGKELQKIVLGDSNCNIIIVSKQLLDDYTNEHKVTNIDQIDIICFDENHFGGTTTKASNIFNTYANTNTVKIYLTATYQKPLHQWNIANKCQYYWDIEDEQFCKNRDIDSLAMKHGDLWVKALVNEANKDELMSVYDKMPNMHIISTIMDNARYEMIREKIQDTKYGFSMDTLFSLAESGKEFNYPEEVIKVLRYISGSNKEVDYPMGDESILNRIKNLSLKMNSRTTLNNQNFTSQLWFLPFGKGMVIEKVSECLMKKMMNDAIFKNYEIMIINSKKEYKLKDLKLEIANRENQAKSLGKTGLILLAGNQCSLGITLPLVDIVMLLNNTMSSDRIIQMMYRCMSETEDGSKKNGYVVDLNLSRILNTVIDLKVSNSSDLSIEGKIQYIIENNLINIDADMFNSKDNKTKIVEKLLEIWKSNPVNNFTRILKKIADDVIELEHSDQTILNQYFVNNGNGNGNNNGNEEISISVKFDDEIDQVLPNGKTTIDNNEETIPANEETIPVNEDDTDVANISLTQDILPYLVPLICLLTLNNNNKDLIDMLETIKANDELMEIFNEQSFIWWNKKDIIELVIHIVKKYIPKSSNIYNIAIQFKMSLQSLIDQPEELLELINSCLKPKDNEKKQFGEVFTPMNIINEMLDELDKHHLQMHDRSIFEEKDYKWFDPANGMGNFPIAIYMRLMDGLKDQIENESERKRHILEEMLYMSEINKKNVYVSGQIFDINNEYQMNIYCGNSLELETEKEWGVKGFDVVIGNPPYNKGGIKSHTGKQLGNQNETIWLKFVKKTLSEWLKPNGYLVFINPLSWLKKSHSVHNKMLEKHVVWLKLWDNSQSKSVINADIPISLYVLHNKDNKMAKEKTKIISIMRRRDLKTESEEYLNADYSIPLAYHNIFNKLAVFIQKNGLEIEYKTKMAKSTGIKSKIPESYTADDMLAVDTYTIKDGIMVKKMTEKHEDMNKRKLIIANKASLAGAFIDEGKLGLTGNDKSYILGDNLDLILKLLRFKISDIISHYTKYRQDFLDKEIYAYLPDIRKLGLNNIDEIQLYEMIGLNKEEIVSINPNLVTIATSKPKIHKIKIVK